MGVSSPTCKTFKCLPTAYKSDGCDSEETELHPKVRTSNSPDLKVARASGRKQPVMAHRKPPNQSSPEGIVFPKEGPEGQ